MGVKIEKEWREIDMTIGEKIQKCRKEQKMSQEELAGRLGVSRQAVSKWELNESVPSTERLIILAQFSAKVKSKTRKSKKQNWRGLLFIRKRCPLLLALILEVLSAYPTIVDVLFTPGFPQSSGALVNL